MNKDSHTESQLRTKLKDEIILGHVPIGSEYIREIVEEIDFKTLFPTFTYDYREHSNMFWITSPKVELVWGYDSSRKNPNVFNVLASPLQDRADFIPLAELPYGIFDMVIDEAVEILMALIKIDNVRKAKEQKKLVEKIEQMREVWRRK